MNSVLPGDGILGAAHFNDGARTLVIVPTYNELASLELTVSRILKTLPQVNVLIVDDSSPDGTGALADRLAAESPRIHVLHRQEKQGLGAAYVAGFAWALDRDFEAIVEFDADGSHQPEQLPALLAALTPDTSVVIGTRWMPGGAVHNWPWYRRFISRSATRYARFALRSRLRDVTSGMRVFRAAALKQIDFNQVSAHGYCFQIELAWLIERSGLGVAEVPIDFVERAQGASKMSFGIVLEALWLVTWWGFKSRFAKRRTLKVHRVCRGNRI